MLTIKEKNFISAVVYIKDTEQVIESFLTNLVQQLDAHFEKYEIICVNDYCKDKSMEIIKKISNKMTNSLSIVNMSFFQGIELAMNAGVDLAIGDLVFEFDTVSIDYPLDTIMDVYYHALEGYDIVNAAPSNSNSNTSRLFYAIFNKFSKGKYQLRTESFRILSRRAINRVHGMSKTIPYRKAFYANCGLKSDTIIYLSNVRNISKKTKQIKENRKELAISSIVLFTDIAYRFAITLTCAMMLVTIGTGLYTIIVFLGNEKPVAGWTTTMLLLSFAFFGLFAIAAIIIKYLTVIMNLVFNKQRYMVESIEKISK